MKHLWCLGCVFLFIFFYHNEIPIGIFGLDIIAIIKPLMRGCISVLAAKKESCFMCSVFISSIKKQKAVAANARIKLFFLHSFYSFVISEFAAYFFDFHFTPLFVYGQSRQRDF